MLKLKELHPTTKRLILTRAFRSIGQGALAVDMTLYLNALGWNAFHIGLVLSIAGIFGALLSLGAGIASDRIRRRPFLIIYEIIVFVCSITAFLSAQSLILSEPKRIRHLSPGDITAYTTGSGVITMIVRDGYISIWYLDKQNNEIRKREAGEGTQESINKEI